MTTRIRRGLVLLTCVVLTATCGTETPTVPNPGTTSKPALGPGVNGLSNLLADGDFEAGGSAWTNVGAPSRALVASPTHGGTAALEITSSPDSAYEVYQDVAVTAGSSYSADGWISSDQLDAATASIEVLWLDASGLASPVPSADLLGTASVGSLAGTQAWTAFNATVVAPAGAVVARLQLTTTVEPDSVGRAWFDDLSLTLIPPPDVTPPTVNVTSPVDGATVAGSIQLTADATDDGQVAGVTFQVDGAAVGPEITQPPYETTYSTTALRNGAHQITAVARDTAAHSTTSAVVNVTVNNPRPRDIVLFLTDDQRWDLMPYMPKTTARMSTETVRFTNGFVTTSMCCPSRASILTGRYAHNHQMRFGDPTIGNPVFDATSTVAVWLQSAGYRTALVGKYLNGYDLYSPMIPPGWSDFRAMAVRGGVSYYNYKLNLNGTVKSYGTSPADYGVDVLTQQAINVIQTAPYTQPLFLYFALGTPHAPSTPGPGDAGGHASFPNWRPKTYNENSISDKPAWIRAKPTFTTAKITASDAFHKAQLDALSSIDRSADAIINALIQSDRWANTLFVFASDNGLAWGEHRLLDVKLCPYDECIRVPYWVRAPGLTQRNDPSLIANIDLAPSFAEWAGISAPATVNGRSFIPLLTNAAAPWRTELLIEHWGESLINSKPNIRMAGIRTPQYMYNEYESGEREFYNMITDPLQDNNVVTVKANATIVAQLKAKLAILKVQ